MRAMTVTDIDGPDRVMRVQMPADVPSGTHQVVVVLNALPSPPASAEWILPVHNVGPWPEGFTLRREDIYGDDDR